MQNKPHLTGAQLAGWIIWWLVTVLMAFVIIILAIVGNNSWAGNVTVIIFGGLYLVEQVIMVFALKRLHRNDSFVWPIVAIVVAVLGSMLYLIPGIWGLVINTNARNQKQNNVTS